MTPTFNRESENIHPADLRHKHRRQGLMIGASILAAFFVTMLLAGSCGSSNRNEAKPAAPTSPPMPTTVVSATEAPAETTTTAEAEPAPTTAAITTTVPTTTTTDTPLPISETEAATLIAVFAVSECDHLRNADLLECVALNVTRSCVDGASDGTFPGRLIRCWYLASMGALTGIGMAESDIDILLGGLYESVEEEFRRTHPGL